MLLAKRDAKPRDGTDALSRLFYPLPVTSDGGRGPADESDHLEALDRVAVTSVFGRMQQWLRAVYALGRCPNSGKPVDECAGCRQPAGPIAEEDVSGRQPSQSPFYGGTRREPHAPELAAAIYAALAQLVRIYQLPMFARARG